MKRARIFNIIMKKSTIYYWFILTLILPLLFPSCSEKVKMEGTNKTFYVSHDYKPNRILLLNHNEKLFCISYFEKTDKRIEISNLATHEKDVIPLPENVSGYHVLSNNPDSIFIYDNICNEIHLITNTGYQETLNMLTTLDQKMYEFYLPSQLYNNALYVSGYHSSNDYSKDNSIKAETSNLRQIVENERVFVFKNLFTDSIHVKQMLRTFVHSEIVKKADYTSTLFLQTRIFNNDLICFHANSNILYVFNRTTGDMEGEIKLSSEYTDLKAPLIRLYSNKKERDDFLRKRQESAFHNGLIYNITYDTFRKLFFVTTLLPNEDFHYRDNLTFERDWTLIVLDDNYKTLGEFWFSGAEFDFRTIHPIKEGLLIKKKHKKNENKKTEFSLFEVY